MIVIPSISLDPFELNKVKGAIYYEERQLFNLILLRKPNVRLIYVTSMPLDPAVIEYYWKLLPEKIPLSEMQSRITFFSLHDDSTNPLSQKILAKSRLVERLKRVSINYFFK